jgi:subtilisin family serine protease
MPRLALVLIALQFSVAGWSKDLPRYALILSDPAPIKARAEGGQAAVEAARTKVLAAQAAVASELKARGVRITGASHTLLNAIFVAAEPDVAAQLTSIDGVIQVARLGRFHLNLDHAVQLINVAAAYSLIGGASNAGAGIKIGMIDTGITATHPAFQDSSLTPPAGFPICAVNFGTVTPQWVDCTATDATKGFPICPSLLNCAYTNNKVIVARSYVPLLNSGDAATSTPA